MERSASTSFLKATVQVPAGAWGIDLMFSDSASSGGFHDDNGGLDYHTPIEGSDACDAGLKVVHISCEMAPIAKVGGMGDGGLGDKGGDFIHRGLIMRIC
ncbi:MAG: hypothetical protein WDW38_005201 [Sanguina aurantia]